jgi:nitrite reductase (NO-forming)
MTTAHTAPSPTSDTNAGNPMLRRLHAAAVVRIVFGVVWAVDATFKWLPGFIHGETLGDELGGAKKIHTPLVHEWISLWSAIGSANPGAFAAGTAIVETVIAVCLLLGLFSNAMFVGSAIFSFGIWSAAEGFHLPWSRPGITDLGPSVGYIIASLALLFACAGATWSLDSRLHGRLGRFARLAGSRPSGL